MSGACGRLGCDRALWSRRGARTSLRPRAQNLNCPRSCTERLLQRTVSLLRMSPAATKSKRHLAQPSPQTPELQGALSRWSEHHGVAFAWDPDIDIGDVDFTGGWTVCTKALNGRDDRIDVQPRGELVVTRLERRTGSVTWRVGRSARTERCSRDFARLINA